MEQIPSPQLIEDIGAETWLKELLDILSLPRVEYDGHDIINPALTVKISDKLQDNLLWENMADPEERLSLSDIL